MQRRGEGGEEGEGGRIWREEWGKGGGVGEGLRAAHLARTQRARGASDRASAARGEEMEEREGIEEGRGRRGREQRERGVTGGLERRREGAGVARRRCAA